MKNLKASGAHTSGSLQTEFNLPADGASDAQAEDEETEAGLARLLTALRNDPSGFIVRDLPRGQIELELWVAQAIPRLQKVLGEDPMLEGVLFSDGTRRIRQSCAAMPYLPVEGGLAAGGRMMLAFRRNAPDARPDPVVRLFCSQQPRADQAGAVDMASWPASEMTVKPIDPETGEIVVLLSAPGTERLVLSCPDDATIEIELIKETKD